MNTSKDKDIPIMDIGGSNCNDPIMNRRKSYYFISACVVALIAFALYKKRTADVLQIVVLDSRSADSKLSVTFVGVTTLLFDDGETSFMTDGFFSRPGKWEVLSGSISPNESAVNKALKRLGVNKLAAIIPLHSHYDHALDSAMVAKKSKALMVGSESTANIARSFELPEDQIKIVRDGEQLELGKFKITFITSAHSPEAWFSGMIDSSFEVPARIDKFQMGDCYSLFIEHEGRSILVHGSAGYIPGKLAHLKADMIYIGIGTLGRQSEEFMNSYWEEVVKASQARRIVLIHWDDFFKSLGQPLTPLPWPMDDLKSSLEFLSKKAKKEKVDIRLPVIWQASDPFLGLDSVE